MENLQTVSFQKKWCVVRKSLFSHIRILVLTEFYPLETHLTGSTRPMLVEGTECAEQKLVITFVDVAADLPPLSLQSCVTVAE